ncbi:MAG: acyl--CoA ligase [Kiritimatiellae bacterium]|nr:acyl--CoA ligase [Kiritimatiellia bacterium]
MKPVQRTFGRDFLEIAERRSREVAFVTPRDVDTAELTYGQVALLVRRCWTLFRQHGLAPGDTVMGIMPNAPDTLVLLYAALAAGMKYAPLACTATEAEVTRWGRLVRPSLALVSDLLPAALQESVKGLGVPVTRVTADGAFGWLPPAEAEAGFAAGKLLLSTSGTTGEPKAMVIDGDTLWAAACAFADFHYLRGRAPRFWNYLPVSYLGGLFNLGLIPLAAEGSVVVDDTFSGKTYLTYWQFVERHGIDTLWLVPTIVRGLVTLGRAARRRVRDLESLVQRCFLGTAPIDLGTKREFEVMFGQTLLENYALSETTFLTSETPATLEHRSEGSVGEVLPGVELEFRPVREAESGESVQEVRVRTPFLFDGYLGEGGVVSRPVDDEGWFPTGDLGQFNDGGALVITGRTRDVVKKGGYLIALREIERIAEGLEGVQEAAAVRVRHDFYGESYVLYVVPAKPAGDGFREQTARALHAQLASYRWPEEVLVAESLPKTSSGKIRKGLLAR